MLIVRKDFYLSLFVLIRGFLALLWTLFGHQNILYKWDCLLFNFCLDTEPVMKKKKRGPKFKLHIGNVNIEYKDDSILLEQLTKFISLALELADIEDKDEIERIQKGKFI